MRILSMIALGLTFAVVGCSDDGAKIVSVSGVVTLNGSPLADASVTTQPIGGEVNPGSFARTDAQGRFTLKVVGTNQSGAAIGKHRVVISKQEGGSGRSSDEGGVAAKETLPERYNGKSELRLEVPAGGVSGHKFELTKP